MKFLIFTDNHFCETYSIVNKRGAEYSVRLENQIESMNWLERKAEELGVDGVFCLGDFFDKPDLKQNEISALKEIEWSDVPHWFIVGNHESGEDGLAHNSTKALESSTRSIISSPVMNVFGDTEVCFLPYVTESSRLQLREYFGDRTEKKRVILSHNDVKGIQMGPVTAKTGFELEDIDASCDLFLNGHLHNGVKFAPKGWNLGNFTGKDFGEDAKKHPHCAFLLDTDTLSLEQIENPFALNFYQIEIKSSRDIKKLDSLKSNAVLSVKCADDLVAECKEKLASMSTVVASRVIIVHREASIALEDTEELSMDYMQKLVEVCLEKLDNTTILKEELAEICK